MRKCKIIGTIGPASESPAMLERLMKAGLDVCRLNFSFGTHEEHCRKIAGIRAAAKRCGKSVAILQDLQGPKIRVGKLEFPVHLAKGAELTLTGDTRHLEPLRLPTTYRMIASDAKAGDVILLADGKIILRVLSSDPKRREVKCKTLSGGQILSGKGINLPYTKISLPALTSKDREDAVFGAGAGVDFMGLSFVRSPDDVRKLKSLLKRNGAADLPIIAKIEKPEALERLDGILDAVEGVMVARGDLAVELSFAKLPAAQKMIIHKANMKGRLAITATEMLGSMVENPLPSRAEVSDVANAVWDGTDAVMLSNETAMGKHPLEAVRTMDQVVSETESAKGVFRHQSFEIEEMDMPSVRRSTEAVCKAAAALSREASERGLAVFTMTGEEAMTLSKFRPDTTIFAISPNELVCNRMALYHNVRPIFAKGLKAMGGLDSLAKILRDSALARPGDEIICLEDGLAGEGVDSIRLVRLPR